MKYISTILFLMLCISLYSQAEQFNISIPRNTTYFSAGFDILNSNPGEYFDASTMRLETGYTRYVFMDPFTYFFYGANIGFVNGYSHSDPARSFSIGAEAGIFAEQSVGLSGRAHYYWQFKSLSLAGRATLSPMDWFDKRRFIFMAYLEGGMVDGTGYAGLGLIVPINLDRK